MSYCKKLGKDEIIVVTREDHDVPPTGKAAILSSTLGKLDEDEPGFVLPDGKLNWSCPCVGSMVAGPCGFEFRQAFGCFHFSVQENKGSDCVETFKAMHSCMAQFPTLYGNLDKDLDKVAIMEASDEENFADSAGAPKGSDVFKSEKQTVLQKSSIS